MESGTSTVEGGVEGRWIKLADTASLVRDVGFLVLASGLPWYVHHVEQREIALVEQYEARQAAFDWYARIALNALNQRPMMVGGEILLECQSTGMVMPGGLREADLDDQAWAQHDHPAPPEESAASLATPRLSRTGDGPAAPRPNGGAS